MTTALARPLLIAALLGVTLLQVPAVAGSISRGLSGGGADDDRGATIAFEVTEVHALTLGREGMMPGDSVVNAIELRNHAHQELRYAVSGSTAGGAGLASILVVAISTADTGSGTAAADDGDACDDSTGAVVRPTDRLAADGNLVGDRSQGAQPGDRTLAAGTSEVLCLSVELPLSAGNELQGASTAMSFAFVSEATANNP